MRRGGAGSGGAAWLWLLVTSALLTQTALNLVRPVTTYKLLSLGAGPLAVGLVTAAYALLPLASAMWLGRATARTGRLRHMMVWGAVVLAAGAAGTAVAPSLGLVAAASALLGLGHLVFTIAGQAAVARHLPDDQLDKGFGWFTAAYAAGQLCGPLMAGLFLGSGSGSASPDRAAGIALALWTGVVVSLLTVLTLAPRWARTPATGTPGGGQGAGVGRASADKPGTPEPRATVARILRVPGIPSHILASIALLGIVDILTAFLPLLGERHGVAPAVVGALLAARGGASILSRALLPWLSRRLPTKTLLLSSLYGAGASLALVPGLMGQPWLAGACLFLGGFCLGLGQPMTMSLVSIAVPGTWRGAALAVRLMGNRFGQVVLPLVAGLAAAGLGPAGAVWASCALLGLSGLEKSLRR